ncbi:MAG: RNA-binding transcriptional accessory protein [Lachnospiraceae bacterium]|nr:RNA-binding transcriptional accessory protein [Lachnospiraceae bacterium]
MDINAVIAAELGIRPEQVNSAVSLIDKGNTIPFIARYRKEATGSLDDVRLRALYERLGALRALEERRAAVLRSVEEQGKLTPELKTRIEEAGTLNVLEDLYLPYRPKRKKRASTAIAKGLLPLADYIMEQTAAGPLIDEAAKYVTPSETAEEEKRVATAEDALRGAMDILAERFSDDAGIREFVRNAFYDRGVLTSSEKKGASDKQRRDVYGMYFSYAEAVKAIPGHRILAVDRGENEGILSVSIEIPEEQITDHICGLLITGHNRYTEPVIREAAKDAYRRLIAPSIERQVRSDLTKAAQEKALVVFKKNLEQLLMQPPVTGRTVMGWDPAYRTGCKIAIVDETGKVLDTTVVYPTPPHNRIQETEKIISDMIRKHGVSLIALGNGTASGESEQVIASIIKDLAAENIRLQYAVVNEAGASVYSASELAGREFPEFDTGQRSASSMARRLQDPLAELVKIDPAALGVGQYQHDMNEKRLSEALNGVVEDCVNRVGADLNTASFSLLSYVSGITESLAVKIVEEREKNGPFRNRRQLMNVPGLGPRTFEQCAGFLRIRDGDEVLDSTAVHPEDYKAVHKMLKELGLDDTDTDVRRAAGMVRGKDIPAMARRLGIGEITLSDILSELERPGRDIREELEPPLLRSGVLTMQDLQPGLKLKGTVRNIVDFGAFVDIGVHQDGLVHISQLSDRFVKDPMDVVKVGDIVDVTVLSCDPEKKRISLSMKTSVAHQP